LKIEEKPFISISCEDGFYFNRPAPHGTLLFDLADNVTVLNDTLCLRKFSAAILIGCHAN